jgi:hypothetical protein
MGFIGFVGFVMLIVGLYMWLALPRLRQFSWWGSFVARVWALFGNSRTIAAAYAAQLLGVLDEAKLIDVSSLIGAEKAGRVLAIMGVVILVLRLVTRGPASYQPQMPAQITMVDDPTPQVERREEHVETHTETPTEAPVEPAGVQA